MTENAPDTNVGNIKYINKQVAIDVLDKEYRYGADIDRCGLAAALDEIEALPAADVVPVVHSQWKYKCGEIQCPECGNRIHRIDLSGYLNFCPNCGAKMDKE